MAGFFNYQLDFILFFYGLAFSLLGAVSFAVARGGNSSIPWATLGAFGYLRGGGEWLGLIALIFGDTPGFALARMALMTASFIALCEFGRLGVSRYGLRVPGRWIYAPILVAVGFGWPFFGVDGLNVFARYLLCLPGAALACFMLALHARKAPGPERRWLILASVALGLYSFAAGAIVPVIPNWDGDVMNYEMFALLTDVPVQFARGIIACLVAFSIWGYWGQRLAVDVASARYSTFQRRQFVWTLSAMGTILVAGWFLTEVLGGIYKKNVELEALGDLSLIASRLNGETRATEGMVKALAGSRSVSELASGNPKVNRQRVDDILSLETEASGAHEGFILDAIGKVLTTSSRSGTTASAPVGRDFSKAPYFISAMNGAPGYYYTIEGASHAPYHYVSFPVRDDSGYVIGAAVLKKSLSRFEIDMQQFDRSFAMVDRDGIVLLTNRMGMRLRAAWPVSAEVREHLSDIYGVVDDTPAMKREITGSVWTAFDGERVFVQRRNLEHGDWSLITWKVPQGIFASRVLGIIITLLTAILALVYLIGRERWMHDNVQLEKRFELEELARNLGNRAATDPLTGLFNRRKLDRSLAGEILRAQRYKTALSLVIFDIDHFKKVNDKHGHQAGDAVLIDLSRYTATHIRNLDVLARWGGEEFVILCPGTNGPMACMLAGNLAAGIAGLKTGDVGTITCSFGIAEFIDGDTAETLLARADDALYRAKSNGRNRIELAAQPMLQSPALVPVAANDVQPVED